MKWASKVEDEVTEALEEETALFVGKAESAISIDEYAKKIWPGVKMSDSLGDAVKSIFTNNLKEFLPKLIEP